MAKILGRASIFAAGVFIDCNKGSTLDKGGIKRTSVVTANGVAGYSEEIVPSKVECSLPMSADVSLKTLHDSADVAITFKTDIGKQYTIGKAWLTDPPTLSDQDGNVKLMFEGEPAEEHS